MRMIIWLRCRIVPHVQVSAPTWDWLPGFRPSWISLTCSSSELDHGIVQRSIQFHARCIPLYGSLIHKSGKALLRMAEVHDLVMLLCDRKMEAMILVSPISMLLLCSFPLWEAQHPFPGCSQPHQPFLCFQSLYRSTLLQIWQPIAARVPQTVLAGELKSVISGGSAVPFNAIFNITLNI